MGSAISVLYLPKHQPTFYPTSRSTYHSTMVWEAVFKFFDGDNSGMIDFNEVKTKSAALGASADKLAKLEAIFKAHDADGDGELSISEFRDALASKPKDFLPILFSI